MEETARTTTAKFYVTKVTQQAGYTGASVELSPVPAHRSEENLRFWEATPAGKIELTIQNPMTAILFELEKEFYVTFSQAPEA